MAHYAGQKRIRRAQSGMENDILDQSSPLAIQPSKDWRFDPLKVSYDHHPESNYQGWSFFPAFTIDWHKEYTHQMSARMCAIQDHWQKINRGGVYQFQNWYAGDKKLKQEELSNAFQEHGRVTVVFYASLDPKGKHHINKRSLELAHKRYGHLFTQEWMEKANLKPAAQ